MSADQVGGLDGLPRREKGDDASARPDVVARAEGDR